MQYLSVMYRRKADLDRGDEGAREDDVDSANGWMQKAMEAQKYRETHEVNDSRGASSGNPEIRSACSACTANTTSSATTASATTTASAG